MMLGAYTRLTDAGLGCPDWPACYGQWVVNASTAIANPALHLGKAWTEMLHRYMAGLLGLGIAGLIVAWLKQATHHKARILPCLIGVVLLFQALLGMWTVTLKLWPVVVMGHLMGGMLLLSLLWMTTLNARMTLNPKTRLQNSGLRIVAAFTLFILILQIALGGWTSANYAALVCPDFPNCHTGISVVRNVADAFHLQFIHGGVELLSANALMTIHMLHRIGAVICALLIGSTVFIIWRKKSNHSFRKIAATMAILATLQIGLGIANVLAKIPLPIALAHHAVSALLLLSVITLNVALYRVSMAEGIFRTRAILGDYLTLCKPKVVLMMLVTAFVGMCLSVEGPLPWVLCLVATLGIGLCSASAAVLNHLIDRTFDSQMIRTQQRPMAQQRIGFGQAMLFAGLLASTGFSLLSLQVNTLCALLTLLACMGYALIYSLILKHRTPQNIVIGGLSGAMPPALGWAAIANEVTMQAWILVLIIFVWTPPHFWALALYRRDDYAKSGLPMLPITHGMEFTRFHVWLYTIILVATSLLPYAVRMSGLMYLISAVVLGLIFLWYAWRIWRHYDDLLARKAFAYSIIYLSLLFAALLIDHYLPY